MLDLFEASFLYLYRVKRERERKKGEKEKKDERRKGALLCLSVEKEKEKNWSFASRFRRVLVFAWDKLAKGLHFLPSTSTRPVLHYCTEWFWNDSRIVCKSLDDILYSCAVQTFFRCEKKKKNIWKYFMSKNYWEASWNLMRKEFLIWFKFQVDSSRSIKIIAYQLCIIF